MKTIKQYILHLLAFMAILSGCSENEFSGVVPEVNGVITLSGIHVSDGGYNPVPGTTMPQTRATENEKYQTIFTAGDRIGVFAVKDGVIIPEVNNLCLTALFATGTTNSLAWADASGKDLFCVPGATYYAYYPYQQSLNGTPDFSKPIAPDADVFFADVVSRWNPAADQSTYAAYTAQDLMIAKGSISATDKRLSFIMRHQMALVVMNLPKILFKLLNGLPYKWFVDAPDTRFKDFIPYHMSDGTNRYLVKPSVSKTLKGSYANDIFDSTSDVKWSITTGEIDAGKYKTFTVDNGMVVAEKIADINIGDFYMIDGSIVGKNESLSAAQIANCIGIIYFIGDISGDNFGQIDSSLSGLAVSLWDVVDPEIASKEGMTWTYGGFESVQDKLSGFWINSPENYDLRDPDKCQGYINTIALRKYSEYVIKQTSADYGAKSEKRIKPIDALAEFSSKHPTSLKSTDWYWPSVAELRSVSWGKNGNGIIGKETLNTQLGEVGGTTFGNECYWSSTEKDGENAYCVDFTDGTVKAGAKGERTYRVRPIFAF